jgi:hypothetical protein
MYLQELLEVVIGLVFVWLGLALACMGVQEWIASLFKFRARDLEKAIRGMLDEPPPRGHVLRRFWEWAKRTFGGLGARFWRWLSGAEIVDTTLTRQLYDHPLIRALAKPGKKPSYIPDRTFAMALFDVVMTAGTEASMIQDALEALPEMADKTAQKGLEALLRKAQDAVSSEEKLAELREELEEFKVKHPQLKPMLNKLLQVPLPKFEADDKALKQITESAVRLALSNPKLAQALTSLTAGVKEYADKKVETPLALARTNTETWFNDTMARLTGWYKRRSQVIGIILGLVFAVVLNVDSLVIATTLWREPTVRQALVAKAEEFKLPEVTEGAPPEDQAEVTETSTTTPILTSTSTLTPTVTTPAEAIEAFNANFEGLHLPMGWVTTTLTSKQECTWKPWTPADEYALGVPIGEECWMPLGAPEGGIPRDWNYGLPKILGLLISGLAASLGAPFWFDVLKKLVNMRSAGKNPAEEEPKKKA